MITPEEEALFELAVRDLSRDPDTENGGDLVYAVAWGADELDRAARRAALASIRQPTKAELAALMGGDDA